MAYTAINKSTDYFNTKLWTGNSTNSTAITGVGFQPDLAWIKNRSTTDNHALFDAIRGATYRIASNAATANTQATNSLASFDSDGFTLNDGGDANGNGENIVGWNWKANGAGSSNSDGSITSTVSVSTASGFSIVKWTGSGSNATIGHGLGKVPKLIIVKNLATTDSWNVYHASLGNGKRLFLDTNGAESSTSDAWNSTSPTSSVFSIGTNTGTNNSGSDLIAYCFAEIDGHSKIGQYTGNGNADGAFVYCGFRPSFILTKTTGTDNWRILDDKRLGYNPNNSLSQPSLTQADSAQTWHDILSNGFKLRTTDTGDNGSGTNYIFYAVGQSLVGTNNIPVVAR
jgi:hypothetical protein